VQSQILPWRLPQPVYRFMGATLAGEIYVLGGLNSAGTTIGDVEAADPATGTVTPAGLLAEPTHGGAAVTVGDRILVFGGADTTVHTDIQAFNPGTGSTQIVGQLPGPRADVAAASVGSEVLLLGGFDGTRPLQSVLVAPNGSSFQVAGQLAEAVRYPAVAVDQGEVYLFGGLLSGGEYTGTFTTAIERVDPATGTAMVVANLPVPLAHAMAAVLGGQILLIGGSTPSGPSAEVYDFEPGNDTLAPIGSLPEPVTDGTVAVVGQTAYVLGGISAAPIATVIAVHLVRRSR
jgi:N-acetylneuraminic acid mutarotase